jgi:hypothetical protein
MPVELGLKFRAVVGLDLLDDEGQLLEHVVDELDRGLLVEAVLDAKYPNPRAVIDGGELIVAFLAAAKRSDELHVDLNLVARERLLIALPSPVVTLVALRGRQAVHVEALQDPPHPRLRDLDVVIALQVHRDLLGPKWSFVRR